MTGRLAEQRILVTSADTYMGPPIVELFRAEGADVIADTERLVDPAAPAALVKRDGELDVVIVNLDLPAYTAKTVDIEDEPWFDGFDAMTHPLMRLVRACAPAMIERGRGSIVALTSSSPLRRMTPQAISYVTARPPRTRSSAPPVTTSPVTGSDSTRSPRTSSAAAESRGARRPHRRAE